MAVGDEFIQELKSRADIETVIAANVNLRRRGRTLVGLCPFHNEKTPSFTVYPDTQSYYCFGCGAGGDVISFTRRIQNLDYMEAVKYLAQTAGLDMPEDGYDDTLGKRRRRMYEANREAARYFHKTLFEPEGRTALAYLQRRGVSRDMITRFGLGCAPDGWDGLLTHMRQKGFSSQELFEADLAKKSDKNGRVHYYDNFRNRFITPIIDLRGNVVAFGGRVLDDSKPKYVNTSDTLVYSKRQGVFALNFAKDSGTTLILAEGYMDVIALHQAGFTNAVACLGTALTSEQVKILSRYAEEIVLSYDADEAGQTAARKALNLFAETPVKVRVLRLNGGKDPDEILKKHGPERFRSLLDGAANDIEYKLLREREKYDVSTTDGKRDFLEASARILAYLNPIERDVYAGRLAEEFGINKSSMMEQAKYLARRMQKRQTRETDRQAAQKLTDVANPKVNPARARCLRAANAEEMLIATLAANPDTLHVVESGIAPEDFVTPFNARVFQTVLAKLAAGANADISAFHTGYTDDEVNEVTRIINLSSLGTNARKVCEDCINVILAEKAKKQVPDPATADNEAWKQLFKK